MDDLRRRLDALEHHLHALHQHTHTVERRLRWWRGLACSLVVLGLLTWALPVVTADDAKNDLEQRLAALETLLAHFSRQGNEVLITGANLHIVNGLGRTDCTDAQGEPMAECPNGLGNVIVGYNEPRDTPEGGEDRNVRTGSHNVVVGPQHNYSRVGGLVVGVWNESSGDFAAVSGGRFNTASGFAAAVSGGSLNTASGAFAAVSGGTVNTASGSEAVVSGGTMNMASEFATAVSGGCCHAASGVLAVVSGGTHNTASGVAAAVGGGYGNTASDELSAVSGGRHRTAAGAFDWVAGPLFADE
jgi:hypothetical protein